MARQVDALQRSCRDKLTRVKASTLDFQYLRNETLVGLQFQGSGMMVKTVAHEVQTTLESYLKEIPHALGHMDYEVRGDRVVAHSPDGTIVISLTYEGKRHLGSLNLPMTQVEISLIGFSDDKADAFLKHYDGAMMRTGGG